MTLSQNLRFVFFAAVVTAGGAGGADKTPDVKKASDEQIAKLIADLGSDEFDVRDQASRRLAEMEEALPALRQAMKSDDAEVRRGSAALVGLMEARIEERFIRESVARVNGEGLDLFIDRMVLEKNYATEARWKALNELTKALAKRAVRSGAKVPNILEQNFFALKLAAAIEIGGPSRVLVDGVDGIVNAHDAVILSSGSLAGINSTNNSILFVNGDIRSLNSTTNSVIICNGTIKSFNYTKGCLIICNGVIESMNCTEDNAIFVRGELRRLNYTKGNVIEADRLGNSTVSEGNTYLNKKEADVPRGKGDSFVRSDVTPLSLFQFFDPARAGLQFAMVEGGVQIEKLLADKPFARAGLQKGDRVVAMDGEKVLSADAFTRLLRRKVAAGKVVFQVQREDRMVDIPVAFDRQ